MFVCSFCLAQGLAKASGFLMEGVRVSATACSAKGLLGLSTMDSDSRFSKYPSWIQIAYIYTYIYIGTSLSSITL